MTMVFSDLDNFSPSEQWLFVVLFLFLASTVMAESRLKLDFPDEFYTQGLTDKKFERSNRKRENTDETTRKWHHSGDKPENKSRWKNIELNIGTQGERRRQPSDMLHDRFSTHRLELEPQFEIRF